MLKKLQLTAAMLLIAVMSFAQYFTVGVDAMDTPSALQKAEQFAQSELDKGYDFTLPATERVILPPTFEAINQGNWGIGLHGVEDVYSYVEDNKAEKVALFVIDDTGGYTHDAINWLPQFAKTFTGETDINQGRHGHHVTGIAMGYSNSVNLGIAWPLAKHNYIAAIPLKGLTNNGSGQYTWIANALFYAKQIIPQLRALGFTKFVANLSLGGSSDNSLVNQALSELEAEGVYIVAAAGNTGNPPVQFPGRSPYTQASGALTKTSSGVEPASYTSQGIEVVYAGAGTNVYSCGPNNTYYNSSGTSMGAPQNSGLAALLMGVEPTLTLPQVKQRMINACVDVPPAGKDNFTGYGYPLARYLLNIEDNPDDPDTPVDPVDPEPPSFTSTLTYEMDGPRLYYKSTTESDFVYLSVNDFRITVTGQGNSDLVYDSNNSWSEDYFKNTRMVIPDNPQWGHCLTAYWVGQFYEYISRNQGIGAQISWLEGTDHDGQRCIQTVFNRANLGISHFVRPDGITVMQANTALGTIVAYYNPDGHGKTKRCNWLRRIFGCKRPKA